MAIQRNPLIVGVGFAAGVAAVAAAYLWSQKSTDHVTSSAQRTSATHAGESGNEAGVGARIGEG